ncbi:hypothetical protein D9758_000238 [Tetrapyrgos nigripes]|uniref:Zn(2)-C6 fungal-type domain-containing protein n=1 Tax=Tetrapyrgos nigripes TaxID=182062 RepID=A0A8H5H0I1_9AGAR|nr:hypothetical protein D9758_000238 [Tetrapyrgos nigripes]
MSDLSTGEPVLDQPAPTLARPFRSRKNRPCDGCRRAKTRCAITEVGTPCVECQHTRKKCTFDEQPQERKRPVKRSLSPQQDLTIDTSSINAYKRSRGNSIPVTTPTIQELTRSDGVALEETRGYHVVTAVLTDDLLPVGARKAGSQGDEHIRQISMDVSKPQYVIFSKISDKPRTRTDPLLGIKSALSLLQPPPHSRALVNVYITTSNAAFPILPPPSHVFSSTQSPRSSSFVYTPDSSYPLPLIPKILISALNHAPRGMYRQSVRNVRKVAQTGQEMIDSGLPRSSLSSISDALLDISARPPGNAEDCYVLLAKTIAQAQLLGLHIDPTNWGIPSWEKDFRRVLWWALRVHDGWASFLNSRPSHIQNNNHSVPLPTVLNILGATQIHHIDSSSVTHHSPASSSQHTAPSLLNLNTSQVERSPVQTQNTGTSLQVHAAATFLHLCRLAIFVSRLQTQVCTLMTPREERLGRVMDIEKEMEELLQDARELEADGGGNAPGFASLMTCILGFRCMIRRIAIELSIGLGSPFTPDPETLERYLQAVDYISSLDGSAFDDFWLVHVGHILSSVTSSLIRLSLATSNGRSPESPVSSPSGPHNFLQVDARTNPIFLLCRLRHALQNAYEFHHWDMATPALARADNVAACLQNIDAEYETVVRALKGTLFAQSLSASNAAPANLNGNFNANWNIDLDVFGTGLDWTGFQNIEGMFGLSPELGGFTSN